MRRTNYNYCPLYYGTIISDFFVTSFNPYFHFLYDFVSLNVIDRQSIYTLIQNQLENKGMIDSVIELSFVLKADLEYSEWFYSGARNVFNTAVPLILQNT